MRVSGTLTVLSAVALLEGCGGGGGGGGGTTPPPVARGTVRADTNRPGAAVFSANVTGANAFGTTIQIYADERTGPVNDYTASRRLTLTLYGPLTRGQSLPVNMTTNAGTAYATYVVTERNTNGQYIPAGTWRGTAGTVTVTALDSTHIEGRFDATVTAGSNSLRFQNGLFNLSFESPPPPPG